MKIDKTDSIEEVLKKLEEGVRAVYDSETYKAYLDFLSKFHNYSYSNALLIFLQKPDATLCAGYKTWEKLGRHVNKGETGIRIIAPVQYKREVESEVVDAQTGEAKTDAEGNPVKEKKVVKSQSFRMVSIFDVSQTSGAELPSLGVDELTGDVEDYEAIIDAICRIAPVPVTFEDIEGGAKGYYSLSEKRIVVQRGMSEEQTIKTLVHEWAHSLLHDKEGGSIEGVEQDRKLSRNAREVEAESISYCVCRKLFGIDTGEYSFSYVTSWSQGKELKELGESLDVIAKTSAWMMERVGEEMKQRILTI